MIGRRRDEGPMRLDEGEMDTPGRRLRISRLQPLDHFGGEPGGFAILLADVGGPMRIFHGKAG